MLVAERVQTVTVVAGKATGVTTAQGATAAGHVVIAAGAWSPAIGAVPRSLVVEPVRGQMAATPWPHGTPAAILYDGERYVLTRGEEALLGSTMEYVAFDYNVTNDGLARIFQGAVRLLPSLQRAPVSRTWAGLRPVTPDGRPIVGRDPEIDRLWYATGHGRNGVLLAALTGEIIGDFVSTGQTSLDLTNWQPGRLHPGHA
jgi:glycine oxidase